MKRAVVVIAAATLLVGLWSGGLVASGTALTSMGLIFDVVGALTVLSSLGRYMAYFRIADPALLLPDAVRPLVHRVPFLFARVFGSPDPRATSPGMQMDYTEGWWGGALLTLGFSGQLVGAWLPSGHAWR